MQPHFNLTTKSRCIVLTLQPSFTDQDWQTVKKLLNDFEQKLPEGSVSGVLLKIQDAPSDAKTFLNHLIDAVQAMIDGGKLIFVSPMDSTVANEVAKKRLQKLIIGVQSEDEAVAYLSPMGGQIAGDWKTSPFKAAFEEALVETLKEQGGLSIQLEKAKSLAIKGIESDVAGVIGFLSVNLEGALGLCFKQDAYLHVMSGMLGEKQTQLSPELFDGATELVNIVSGLARDKLNEKDYPLALTVPRAPDDGLTEDQVLDMPAIPKIAKGAEIEKYFSTSKLMVIPVKADKQVFHLIIDMRETKG